MAQKSKLVDERLKSLLMYLHGAEDAEVVHLSNIGIYAQMIYGHDNRRARRKIKAALSRMRVKLEC